MKVLIVNTSDIHGGAARAAYRLHKALLSEGIESRILVQKKRSDDFTVTTTVDTKWQKLFSGLRGAIDQIPVKRYKNRTQTLFSSSWFGFNNVIEKIEEIDPDIVHLHWINGGMIKIEELEKIKKPIVWSLHDMWPFTGGCHYDEGCGRFTKTCGNCKVLKSQKEYDLSRKVFERKRAALQNIENMHIVGLSRWLSQCAQSSTLLCDKKHINLPNPIDTSIFKPFDKKMARALWNLPQDKKLVLFGAANATDDPRKGFKALNEALGRLTIDNVELVIFGSSKPQNPPSFKFKTHCMGYIHDDVSLVTLYSAADLMVVPSLQENLSNAIMESLACATPVVAFDVGGNGDTIEHKQNGYLAKPFDAVDLAKGIEWVLSNENYESLCKNAREKVVREFDSKVVAKKYIELYNEVFHG